MIPCPTPSRFTRRTLGGLSLVLALGFASHAHAQGCVAIKQMGDGTCSLGGHVETVPTNWDLSVSYLHFRSHRHFVKTEEQKQRATAGSEVVNDVDQIDVSLGYRFNHRTGLVIGLPYFSAMRSSLYEHDRVNRYEMHSRGVGDMRVVVDRWVLDPTTMPKGNLSLGLGIKLPTGETNNKDYAHTTTGLVLRNVDQSVQPGDGGWGVIVQAQGFRRLNEGLSAYASGFYLINPKEMNGTRTTSALTSLTAYNSVSDQFQARLGLSYKLAAKNNLTASLGGRIEGVPAIDLVGGNEGFRRPGYVISIEPGVAFTSGRSSFALSVPVAIVRNRIASWADKVGNRHGDAAFADYLISSSYSFKW